VTIYLNLTERYAISHRSNLRTTCQSISCSKDLKMPGGPSGDDLLQTSCPVCGQHSSFHAAESLRPIVCDRCQQLHVATLSVATTNPNVADTAETPALVLPDGIKSILGEIGRYLVTSILGSGAFGVVYKAWDPDLHRWVAIKVPTIRQRKEASVKAFLKEARSAARMQHDRIVSIYDVNQLNGQPYIVSQYVEGVTLAKHLVSGAMPERKAIRFIRDLAAALHYAHYQGIVHRDIKPSNIMIDSKGLPKLMDFGLAQQVTEKPNVADGQLIGTLAYMSPEQGRGDQSQVGPASDQYSLGVVFYECLTGRRLREGPATAVLAQLAEQSLQPTCKADLTISPQLAQVCDRMMSSAIAERYPDLNKVALELTALLKASSSTLIETPHEKTSSRQWVFAGIAASGLVVAGVIMWSMWPKAVTPIISDPEHAPSNSLAQIVAPSIVDEDRGESEPATPIDSENRLSIVPVEIPERARVIAEPPVDALQAIKDSQTISEVPEDNLSVSDLSYPRIELTDEQHRLLGELMRIGFPGKGKELREAGIFSNATENSSVRSNRVTQDAFRKVLDLERQLQATGLDDPRTSYAVAMIRKHVIVNAPGKGNDRIPDVREELEKARTQRADFFPPAYKSLVDFHLTSNDSSRQLQEAHHQAAMAIMIEAAQRLQQPSPWPDRIERKRTAIWLGQVQAYFASKINLQGRKLKSNSLEAVRNEFFASNLEQLIAALPSDLKEIFRSSYIDTQLEIADSIAEVDAQFAMDVRNAADAEGLNLANRIAEQGAEAAQVAAVGQAKEDLVKKLNVEAKEIIAQLEPLRKLYQELQIEGARKYPAFTAANNRFEIAKARRVDMDAQMVAGTFVQPDLYQAAQQDELAARAMLEPLVQDFESLNKRVLSVNQRAAQLNQKWLATLNAARIAKVGLDRETEEIQKKLGMLETESRRLAASNAKKSKSKDNNRRRNVAQFDRWTDWTDEDAENWLIESLRQSR
jgi:serine/threonine protein kinase